MRRVLLLAFAALLAGAGLYASSGAGPSTPSASIAGEPLEAARETAAFEALAAPQPPPPKPPAPARFDLDKIERIGDHYEAAHAKLTLDTALQEEAQKLL